MQEPYPGGRNYIRSALRRNKVPDEAIELMVSSLADSSLKQYDCGLKKWWKFCTEKNLDPFTSSIPDILSLFYKEFENGASHGSVNSLRSAISLIVRPEMAQDSRVKRAFKGISRIRPSKPIYDQTWTTYLSYFRMKT